MGPCDVTLCVLVSDRHLPMLARCIDSARRFVDAVRVGYETHKPKLDPDDCALDEVRIGHVDDFGAAYAKLVSTAPTPWAMLLSADEVVVASPEQPPLAPLIAFASGRDRIDANSVWLPVDVDVDPETGATDRRQLQRRLLRRADGWTWTSKAHPWARLASRSDERRFAVTNVLVRRLKPNPDDVLGDLRRVELLSGGPRDWQSLVDLSRALAAIARREDARVVAREAASIAALAKNKTQELRAYCAEFDACFADGRADKQVLADAAHALERACTVAASSREPQVLMRRVRLADAEGRWDHVVEFYRQWRAVDASIDGPRFDDDVRAREFELPVLAAHALVQLGALDQARRALDDIPPYRTTPEFLASMIAGGVEA